MKNIYLKNIILISISILFLTGCGINELDNTVNNDSNSTKVDLGGSVAEVLEDQINTKLIKKDNNDNEKSISCEENYNELFKKYEKNYSDCYFNKPDTSSCEGKKSEESNINLSIIFDSSGSMGAKIGSETMMAIAKDKIKDYISNIKDEVNLSFVLYGHKGEGSIKGKTESCEGIETIYSFSDNNIASLTDNISNFEPNGYTPIANSLIQAKELIKKQAKENDKNIILLVSDGKETCGGNPSLEALKISKTQNILIDVIGFNVKGDTQKQLMDIAKKGNGNYYDVKSRLDFEQTFNKTKNFLDAMSCGASKAAIELNNGAEAINKYYTCMYSLQEEQIFMMADADNSCKDYFQNKLDSRYEKYDKKFESILNKGENILDNFGNIIKEIEDKLDSGDEKSEGNNSGGDFGNIAEDIKNEFNY